jgi:hypothetical protein
MGSVVGIVPNDKFAYDGQFMASYGLGWFVDSWKTGGATAWLSGYNGIKLFTAGSPRLIIDFPGNVSIPGPLTCQTLTLTSSRRFKDNVQPIRDPLTTIMKLQGVTYTWKPEQGGKPDMGFIAEEVAQVLPELVTMDKDGVHAKGMDYSHMVALTVEGIKAQQQQITTLKAENADLHAQMAVKDTLLQRLLIRLNSLDARVKRLEHGGVR